MICKINTTEIQTLDLLILSPLLFLMFFFLNPCVSLAFLHLLHQTSSNMGKGKEKNPAGIHRCQNPTLLPHLPSSSTYFLLKNFSKVYLKGRVARMVRSSVHWLLLKFSTFKQRMHPVPKNKARSLIPRGEQAPAHMDGPGQ